MTTRTNKSGGITAVVVSGDDTQRSVLSGLLRGEGIDVTGYGSAESALSGMDRNRVPGLIVTELYLQGIDAWRFCRLMRSPEYAAFNNVPILLVSDTMSIEEAARITADLGANAFLTSPVEEKQFVQHIRAILGGSRIRKQLNVLIVEDSKSIVGQLLYTFEANGYRVETEATIAGARKLFSRNTYDVVVLDYHLPDGLGDSLIEICRSLQPDCVCLMMTSDMNPELAVEWMKLGAAAYLKKPFEPEYLIELCARARREHTLLRMRELLKIRTHEYRESEAKYRQLFENAPIGIFRTSSRGQTLIVNAAMASMLGFDSPQDAKTYYSDIAEQLFADPERRETFLKRLRETGMVENFEHMTRTVDGRNVWLSMNARVSQRNEEGEFTIEGYTIDVTARKQAEVENLKLEAQLRQAQKMESIGRLAGGVAHDFNNMLGVILGHAEIASGKLKNGQPIHSHLEEIFKAAMRSAGLTRQLLAFARQQPVTPMVVDLNTTVKGMLKMLQQLIGEDVTLSWLPGNNLWSVKIDPSQIDQTLANLCVNARDAIEDVGRITIETGNVNLDEAYCSSHPGFVPGDYAVITVSDNGCGMDSETMAQIYEPFFTTKRVGEGTGLGLSTVYGIVKQNNGFINVYSEPGTGTRFTIYLPRHTGTAEKTEMEAEPEPDVSGRETILLVEDEPAILKMVGMLLRRQGHKVLSAASPSSAIDLARKYTGHIHLLITDVVMPEMNGRDLSKHMLSIYPDLKILFMSGYTANAIAKHGILEAGVNFMQKPFSPKSFAAKVREVLDSGRKAHADTVKGKQTALLKA